MCDGMRVSVHSHTNGDNEALEHTCVHVSVYRADEKPERKKNSWHESLSSHVNWYATVRHVEQTTENQTNLLSLESKKFDNKICPEQKGGEQTLNAAKHLGFMTHVHYLKQLSLSYKLSCHTL